MNNPHNPSQDNGIHSVGPPMVGPDQIISANTEVIKINNQSSPWIFPTSSICAVFPLFSFFPDSVTIA